MNGQFKLRFIIFYLTEVIKKFLILMVSIVMVFSFAACGGNSGNGESGSSSESSNAYNLDMKSTEAQPMSAERASAEVLRETAQT